MYNETLTSLDSNNEEAWIIGSDFDSAEDIVEASGVCKILHGTKHEGTGFLCKITGANNEEMRGIFTCQHVIKLENEIEEFTFHFQSIRRKLKENEVTRYTHVKRDFVFLHLVGDVLVELDDKKLQFLLPAAGELQIGSDIIVWQYPQCKVKSQAKGKLIKYEECNEILEKQSNKSLDPLKKYDIFHLASTSPGSSGSPILNMNKEVVGIHKSGACVADNYRNGLFNSGTNIQFVIPKIYELKQMRSSTDDNEEVWTKGSDFDSAEDIVEASGVCKIFHDIKHGETGFLCEITGANNVKMRGLFTCQHVIKPVDKIEDFTFHFQKCFSLNLNENQVTRYTHVKRDFVFLTLPEDVLAELNNKELNFLLPADGELQIDSDIIVWQYPQSELKSQIKGRLISYEDPNKIRKSGSKKPRYDIFHLASTSPGSSGYPILNTTKKPVRIYTSGTSVGNDYRNRLFKHLFKHSVRHPKNIRTQTESSQQS